MAAYGILSGSTLGSAVKPGTREDLTAIYNYVEQQRPLIPRYPDLRDLITSFESWYQGLSWWDLNVNIDETVDEAKRRRFAINEVLGRRIPETWISHDAPPTPPPEPEKPAISTGTKITWAIGAVLFIGVAWAFKPYFQALVGRRGAATGKP